MALQTPLPSNLRRGLTNFSGSLFVNNKTGDAGVAQSYHPGHTVLSSLPLQMMLYFNVFYLPFWCLSEGVMLELKYCLLPAYYQFLLLTAYLMLILVETLRLYLGYIGNLQEKVPELAGFVLLSFLIEMPVLLFILTDEHIIRLPLEMAVHLVLLLFLASEIAAAFLALKMMTKQLAMQFYLKQFEEGADQEGQPGRMARGSQWGEVSWKSSVPISPEPAQDP
ncbi:transmembrane protein 17B-like [Sceloporus undulatus]|uniref:transmembrane protein 17B-like n=1 Tax=Sceloporus undulatus TaxID=8520 RepID=UPI001C4A9A40|nr:transmembrane protein 17B-like [Sceloporus undulatus]